MASEPRVEREWDAAQTVHACYLLEAMMYRCGLGDDAEVDQLNQELEALFPSPVTSIFTELQRRIDHARQSLYLHQIMGAKRETAIALANQEYAALSDLASRTHLPE